LNTALYTKILTDDLLGTFNDLGINKKEVYFQQDNDPKHTSSMAKAWFKKKKVDLLDWLPNSPDMNPIKNCWNYLDRQVHSRSPLPHNAEEFWVALQEEWALIEEDYILKLIHSMPAWVQALIEAKGGYTKY
jgi:hypothetical protein